MPEKTQKEEVLEHLRAGKTLTSLEAVELFGITRLAARVHELREDGHAIKDETVTKRAKNGRSVNFSRYYLPRSAGKKPAEEKPAAQERTPFGALSVGARFELDGRQWQKHGAFRAMSPSGPGGGFREVDPGQEVSLLQPAG